MARAVPVAEFLPHGAATVRRSGRCWGESGCRPRLGVVGAAGSVGSRSDPPSGRRRPSPSGEPGWYFTDFVPPAMTGRIGEVLVSLRVWPPDVIPTYSEARRVRTGRLAGFWVAVAFP